MRLVSSIVGWGLLTSAVFGSAGGSMLAARTGPPLARLVAVAVLPADTFAPGPPAGTFRDNGVRGPGFPSQPVQGVSALRPDPAHPGWWLALSDNGFGVRWNSPDYLLCFYRLRPLWRSRSTDEGGGVAVGAVTRLSDPDRRVPFHTVRDDTAERWLTGTDFDPESFVLSEDGTLWIGDELGPFLLHVDGAGRMLAAPVGVPGLVSTDRPGLPPPDVGAPNPATVRRSRGFEGLAAATDGRHLLAMLEGPTTVDPPDQARILEFDPVAGSWTGREWRYRFDAAGLSATELVAYAPDRYLVIERDNGHGDEARHKRVYAIRLGAPGDVIDRRLVVDLLEIADPDHLGGNSPIFSFPFITTEAVWAEDDVTLVLANDNNYPATGGRVKGGRDNTEFIRIRLERPLPR